MLVSQNAKGGCISEAHQHGLRPGGKPPLICKNFGSFWRCALGKKLPFFLAAMRKGSQTWCARRSTGRPGGTGPSALRRLCRTGVSAHWETGKQLGLEVWNLFSSSPDMLNREVGVMGRAMRAELWKVSSAAFRVDALVTEMTIAHDTIAHARRTGRFGSDMCRRLSTPIRP